MKEPINRTKRFEVRLTEDEYNQLLNLEKQLGINRTEIIRVRGLHNLHKVLVDAKQVITALDKIGAELGRSGNNINQLARHANVLNHHGVLTESVVVEFNGLLRDYIRIRGNTEKSLRQIIRLIKG